MGRKVTFPGTDTQIETGEWRTSPYSRVRISVARKDYTCYRCHAKIPKGEVVFRFYEVYAEGWRLEEVLCFRHIKLEGLLELQRNPTWGRTR